MRSVLFVVAAVVVVVALVATRAAAQTLVPPPLPVSLSPAQGSTAGGETVIVRGTRFARRGDLVCRFGANTSPGAALDVGGELVVSCTTPSSTVVGRVSFELSNDGGATFSSTPSLLFTYASATPQLLRVTPAQVDPEGGSFVQLEGVDFAAGFAPRCRFAHPVTGASVDGFVDVASSSLALCLVPALGSLDSESLHLSVSNDGQSFSNTVDVLATVPRPSLSSITPSRAAGGAGESVTLSGVNFVASARSACRFGRAAPVPARLERSVDPLDFERLRVVCEVPPLVSRRNDPHVDVTYANDGENFSNALAFEYVSPLPHLFSSDVQSADATRSERVRVFANGLRALPGAEDMMVCQFGTYPPSRGVLADDGASVLCDTPVTAQRVIVRLRVSNDGGENYSNGLVFEFTDLARVTVQRQRRIAPPVLSSLLPRESDLVPSRAITITGTGFVEDPRLVCTFRTPQEELAHRRALAAGDDDDDDVAAAHSSSAADPARAAIQVFSTTQIVVLPPARTQPVLVEVRCSNDALQYSSPLHLRYMTMGFDADGNVREIEDIVGENYPRD